MQCQIKNVFAKVLYGLKDFFITENDTVFVFEIGLPVIFMLAFSLMTFRRLDENKKEYGLFFIFGMLSLWMATRYFPWKILPSMCYVIQFPWRMLVFSSFFFAIIGSINMMTVIRRFRLKDVLIIGLIGILYIGSRYGVIQYAETITDVEEVAISNVTGQNKEWLPGMGRLEYLPTRAYQNSFYIATRKPGIIALEGNCDTQEIVKLGTFMTAKIVTEDESVKLELPYLYYPGYTVRFDGIILETFETENGFLGCQIDHNEEGNMEIKYTGTKLMNVSKVISILAFMSYLIYVWKKR